LNVDVGVELKEYPYLLVFQLQD
jgi:hypothetical protein